MKNITYLFALFLLVSNEANARCPALQVANFSGNAVQFYAPETTTSLRGASDINGGANSNCDYLARVTQQEATERSQGVFPIGPTSNSGTVSINFSVKQNALVTTSAASAAFTLVKLNFDQGSVLIKLNKIGNVITVLQKAGQESVIATTSTSTRLDWNGISGLSYGGTTNLAASVLGALTSIHAGSLGDQGFQSGQVRSNISISCNRRCIE
jgi:hypothetical protein